MLTDVSEELTVSIFTLMMETVGPLSARLHDTSSQNTARLIPIAVIIFL
jgi:hypothetical protein